MEYNGSNYKTFTLTGASIIRSIIKKILDNSEKTATTDGLLNYSDYVFYTLVNLSRILPLW